MQDASYNKRMEWFKNDRFGMFIHWGLYAIAARGEWVKSAEQIDNESYRKYFDAFDPVDFNPRKWARVAKEAGMKYAVLTAKHHDGFCLFDSKLTDFKSTNTKCGRDIVREYIEAFRAEGLKVGLYYSLLDWNHPDYPHYGESIHPMRANESFKDTKHDFNQYLDYMHGQIRELCENYGEIDILWFDFSYGEMRGEKWRATELIQMVRTLQPNAIIDNRLEVGGDSFGSLLSDNPLYYSGDFVSPEQIIPPIGITDVSGNPIVWEACITMNNNWGYNKDDNDFKSPSVIIRKLVECVSKGGNLLLNVGPDAKGNIPEKSLEVLSDIGTWMHKNKESIYGCSISNLSKPEYGRVTQNGNKIYLHITEAVIGPIAIKGLTSDMIKSIRLLSNGAELKITTIWTVTSYPEYLFLYYGKDPCSTYELPDLIDTVIEIELKEIC